MKITILNKNDNNLILNRFHNFSFFYKTHLTIKSKYDNLISEISSVPLNLKYDSNWSFEILAFSIPQCKILPSFTNKIIKSHIHPSEFPQ